MTIYELSASEVRALEETTFVANGVLERRDLQRLLRDAIHVISPDTLVVSEEFSSWEESGRRIDLLGVDRGANLVVIELKRTEDGGHMELQAIRYAAMVSTMTFRRLVEVYTEYLRKLGRPWEDAQKFILDFLGWESPEEENFAGDVRIVLAASNFSKELTTTVMWLNDRDLDVRCVRLQPYRLDGRLLLDVQQIIPLPEVGAYQVQMREQASERRQSRRNEGGPDFTRYKLILGGETYAKQWKRSMMLLVVSAAVRAGADPLSLPIQRGKWLVVSKECYGQTEFEAALAVEPEAGTRAYAVNRWFSADDELIRFGGRTYCLSNQWGGRTLPIIDEISSRYPMLQVSYEACV